MALSAGPRFRPVSEMRKKGGGEGGREREERGEQGKRGPGIFSREPLINYDHYYHHLGQGH